jgi:peptide/nickel transport system permease protein
MMAGAEARLAPDIIAAAASDDLTVPKRQHSAWRRLIASPYRAVVFLLAIIVIGLAVAAPVIAPYDPSKSNPRARLQTPTAEHWFGTDELGRDIFSRVLYGGRLSLSVSIVSIGFALVVGLIVGIAAGYVGGVLDDALMRLTDVFLAVPVLVLAMAIAAALGAGLENAVIAVAATWWPGYARQIRAQVLAAKKLPYVEAALSMGAAPLYLNRRHILPNCIAPVTARLTLDVGYVVLLLASLSFVGLGSKPPTPDWGTMIAIARQYLISHWTYPTLIGLWISVSVLILTLAGDAVEETLEVDTGARE